MQAIAAKILEQIVIQLMSEKSKVIPIRFSTEELKTIEKFMKKYEMKSMNDVARYGIALLIGMIGGFEKLLASGNLEQIEAWQNNMRNQVSKNKSLKKFGESFQTLEKTVLSKIEEDLAEGTKIVKPFAKKRKSGRPKSPKRNRGKPKDLGHGK